MEDVNDNEDDDDEHRRKLATTKKTNYLLNFRFVSVLILVTKIDSYFFVHI